MQSREAQGKHIVALCFDSEWSDALIKNTRRGPMLYSTKHTSWPCALNETHTHTHASWYRAFIKNAHRHRGPVR